MLGREPAEVAKFLAKTAGLNKTMIGEYLGEREEFCIKVMHAYVDALDFTSKEFDAAIRCASPILCHIYLAILDFESVYLPFWSQRCPKMNDFEIRKCMRNGFVNVGACPLAVDFGGAKCIFRVVMGLPKQ